MFRHGLTSVVLIGVIGLIGLPATALSQGPQTGGTLVSETIREYCVTCHNQRARTADLALDTLDPDRIGENADIWEAVVRKLRTRTMPPADMRRPDAETTDQIVAWVESRLDDAAEPTPGRTTLRRLNRAEYANAIRDLLDLEVDVETLLPPDDAAFGFDNIGDLLGVSPALLERYLDAADRVSAVAVGDAATPPASRVYSVRGDQSQDLHLEGLPLGTVGGVGVDHTFPLDAEYEFQVTLFRTNLEAIRGLEHPHELEISIGGERILLETIGGETDRDLPGSTITERSDVVDARLRARVRVGAGPQRVTAAFLRKIGEGTNRLRPFVRSNADTYDSTGRPHVETLTILGPFDPTGPGDTPTRRRIFTCRPAGPDQEAACARQILDQLARRAYRRDTTEDDLDRLMPFFEAGRARGFDAGIQLALRRLLASPGFVFRVETTPPDVEPGTAYPVPDFELATRLSFFLWSSIPDDRLLDLAGAGQLSRPEVLETEIARMLADPKARALADNFAGQWLHLRNLATIRPNTDAFPDFDDDLRQGFRREAELFFDSVVREDRPVLDLIEADYTWVNERVALHYGIPNVYGSRFRRVTLGDGFESRRGLLGKGAVLMATSHADRTAPTLRGKWILENLMGTAPPPPPPNVPGLDPQPTTAPRTIRERMETHRANPACASCHQLIDPLGYALENFDAVGGWREREEGTDVDASGSFTGGLAIDGVAELRQALTAEPTLFVQTLTEKLMIYALGRGLEAYDMPVVRGIIREAEPSGYRFSTIIDGIVSSPGFRMKRANEPGTAQ